MHLFRSILPTALVCFSFLGPRVSCANGKPTLYEALIEYGLKEYAKFLYDYAPDIAEKKDVIIYAPNDNAVKAYLVANPQQPKPGNKSGHNWLEELIHKIVHTILPRAGADSDAHNAASSNSGKSPTGGKGRPLPFKSNGWVSDPGDENAKVYTPDDGGDGGDGGGGGDGEAERRRRRRGSRVGYGTITSGGGTISNILRDAKEYDNGWLFGLDSFTALGQSFQKTLTDPRIAHLSKILERIPHTRDAIFRSYSHTFFLPTEAALKAAGLNPDTAPEKKLKEFVENHSILNSPGFIGYTPEFSDGVCYRVSSGKGFTSKFTGTRTILNGHATIVVENIITDKGVIQIIDQLLFDGHHPYDCI